MLVEAAKVAAKAVLKPEKICLNEEEIRYLTQARGASAAGASAAGTWAAGASAAGASAAWAGMGMHTCMTMHSARLHVRVCWRGTTGRLYY